ncbi:MAG: hypothetical protein ABR564_06680 [Candidatus Dormibacteria bacterium]
MDRTTRHGSPRSALLFLALTVALPLGLLGQGAWLLVTASGAARGGNHTYDFGLVLTGGGEALVGVAVLIATAVMVLRNPRRARRIIEVTPREVLLPTGPRWARVPVSEISGIGLGAPTTGDWGIMVWRTGGDHTRLAGPGMSTGAAQPDDSAIAQTARELHARIIELQGPAGPLAIEACQRRPPIDPDTRITRVWDPVDGRHYAAGVTQMEPGRG